MQLWPVLVVGVAIGVAIGIGIGVWFYINGLESESAACELSQTQLLKDYKAAIDNPKSTNCLKVKDGIKGFKATCPDIVSPNYKGLVPPCEP